MEYSCIIEEVPLVYKATYGYFFVLLPIFVSCLYIVHMLNSNLSCWWFLTSKTVSGVTRHAYVFYSILLFYPYLCHSSLLQFDFTTGNIRFHVAFSNGVSAVGGRYKAASVRTNCTDCSTWLTAKREGQQEPLDGQSILHDINALVRIYFHIFGKTKILTVWIW